MKSHDYQAQRNFCNIRKKKKKVTALCSVLQAGFQMYTPFLFQELFTFSPMAVAAENRSAISTFVLSYWSKGTCPVYTCLSSWQTQQKPGHRIWSHTLPALRQRLFHPLQLKHQVKNQFCTSNTDQSGGEEDICHILCCPSCWSNYFQQHSRTNYILHLQIQPGVEFTSTFFCCIFSHIYMKNTWENIIHYSNLRNPPYLINTRKNVVIKCCFS